MDALLMIIDYMLHQNVAFVASPTGVASSVVNTKLQYHTYKKILSKEVHAVDLLLPYLLLLLKITRSNSIGFLPD